MVNQTVYPCQPSLTSKARNACFISQWILGNWPLMDSDTGTLSSAIPEMNLRKIRLLSPQSVIRDGPPPNIQIMVANGQLETPKSTIELKFEIGDIGFHEIFIVMEHLTGPIIGLMFLQRNHTVLDMRDKESLTSRSFQWSSKQPIKNIRMCRNRFSTPLKSPFHQMREF